MSNYAQLSTSDVATLRERCASFTLQYKHRGEWIDTARTLGVDSNGNVWLEVPDATASFGFNVLCAGRDDIRKKPVTTAGLVGLMQRATPYNSYDPIGTVHVFTSRDHATEYIRSNYGGSHPDLGDVYDLPPMALINR